MKKETTKQRSSRIIGALRTKYQNSEAFDLDGRGQHFVCEVEPTNKHFEYDRAVEVILSSKPHKHLKTTQYYKIISGTLELYINGEKFVLQPNDAHTITPGSVHWAKSDNECWVEIYSEPGWTKEDHLPVNIK